MVAERSLYSHPVLPERGADFRVGERSLLFQVDHLMRADINPGTVSREGKRFLTMTTDSPEQAQVQLLSDWTSLLARYA